MWLTTEVVWQVRSCSGSQFAHIYEGTATTCSRPSHLQNALQSVSLGFGWHEIGLCQGSVRYCSGPPARLGRRVPSASPYTHIRQASMRVSMPGHLARRELATRKEMSSVKLNGLT
jgi:hypothetical protein